MRHAVFLIMLAAFWASTYKYANALMWWYVEHDPDEKEQLYDKIPLPMVVMLGTAAMTAITGW